MPVGIQQYSNPGALQQFGLQFLWLCLTYFISTGELGYDGLNGTRKIGPSYAKSVVYIWRIPDMHRTGTKHIVRHMQKNVIQWSVITKFTCTNKSICLVFNLYVLLYFDEKYSYLLFPPDHYLLTCAVASSFPTNAKIQWLPSTATSLSTVNVSQCLSWIVTVAQCQGMSGACVPDGRLARNGLHKCCSYTASTTMQKLFLPGPFSRSFLGNALQGPMKNIYH